MVTVCVGGCALRRHAAAPGHRERVSLAGDLGPVVEAPRERVAASASLPHGALRGLVRLGPRADRSPRGDGALSLAGRASSVAQTTSYHATARSRSVARGATAARRGSRLWTGPARARRAVGRCEPCREAAQPTGSGASSQPTLPDARAAGGLGRPATSTREARAPSQPPCAGCHPSEPRARTERPVDGVALRGEHPAGPSRRFALQGQRR